jgi:hypothetical protein
MGSPTPVEKPLVDNALRTPRAAGIAGIIFSTLLICSLWLLRESVPANPLEIGEWLQDRARTVSFALNLVPLAGIAFMWFLGVLRDRLGAREDKLFATVLLGSGLMFLGMMFVAAAAGGGLIRTYGATPNSLLDNSALTFARSFSYDVMHVYAFKMAAVFMIATSTLAIRTHVTPRWIALVGYASAAFLLIGSGFLDWALFVFPFWVVLLSLYILIDNLRTQQQAVADQ